MRARIHQLFDKIKDKENRKIAPVVSVVGFALLVASTVLFILSIIGLFLPGIDGGNFFLVFKLVGFGVFTILVGRQWASLEVKSVDGESSSEKKEIKLLKAPLLGGLDLNQNDEALELTKDKENVLKVKEVDRSENTDVL